MLRAYRLSEPDLTDAGRLLRSAFHGYVTLEANGGFSHPGRARLLGAGPPGAPHPAGELAHGSVAPRGGRRGTVTSGRRGARIPRGRSARSGRVRTRPGS
nr:hypothetical protein GCM10020093_009900 [Planobispora longispora]